ncbi:MAG: hypothetical protein WA426_18490, partial [Silvibacterium sp.]
ADTPGLLRRRIAGQLAAAHPVCHNDSVRRLLAISLLMLFGMPFALPLFGTSAAEANLPQCCRRNGKHHCAMVDTASSPGPSMGKVSEKCPYSIAPPAIPILSSFKPSTAASVFAEIARHPAVAPQTEAKRRISFDLSRQKRGPPAQIV